MSVVLLASGGVDSSVLAAMYGERETQVWPLFVNYGQLAAEREWAACQSILDALPVEEPAYMDLSGFSNVVRSGLTDLDLDINRDAFLPTRNLLLLVVASGYACQRGTSEVAIGLVDESSRLFPDQSASFLRAAELSISEAVGADIRIRAPLLDYTKQEVLSLAAGLGLEGTYSCHRGSGEPCGECVSCKEATKARRR